MCCMIISSNNLSVFSKLQDILCEFCAISKPETATPPALAALAGPKETLFFKKILTASGVEGMLAPSATAQTPLATRVSAAFLSISFWVAFGRAMSHFTLQMPSQHSWYLAFGRALR